MADWLSSLLAGLGAGAESLGTSISEREKRDAAAKQRAFELAMQQADKNAELGITDIAPRLPSDAALTKMSDTIGRIGALGKPQSMDMLSSQLAMNPTASADFGIGNKTPTLPGQGRPASARFDNFTDQTVVPAATPATGEGASASIAKMLQPDMAPPVSKAAAPVSAAEQDLIDYGNQVRTNPKARQTLASVMNGKTPEEQAVYMADRLTAGKLPAARQVEFDKLRAMGPKAYLNDVDIRMTPDMGPPSSLAGSDTLPTAPPSDPSAAPMAPAAGPRTVSALGAPTMPRTRLGSIPDVQSQLPAPSMTTGGVDEGASTVMQYDPLHPEAGLIRKQFNYKTGSDYAKEQAKENLPANMLARQNVESEIANRNATEKRTTAATKDLETKSRYVGSPTGFAADLAALRRDPKNADVLSRVLSMTSGTPNQEVYHRLVEDILIPKTDLQAKRQRITDESELRREYDQFQKARTALLRNKATGMMLPDDLQAAQANLADQERTVNLLADRQDAYGGPPTVYRTNRTPKAAPASGSSGAGKKTYRTTSGKLFNVP